MTDLKSVAFMACWFKSSRAHQILISALIAFTLNNCAQISDDPEDRLVGFDRFLEEDEVEIEMHVVDDITGGYLTAAAMCAPDMPVAVLILSLGFTPGCAFPWDKPCKVICPKASPSICEHEREHCKGKGHVGYRNRHDYSNTEGKVND